MPRKKKKSKSLHYIQLKTHRKFPNQSNYAAYLTSFHSNIQPITYHIQTILNNKWIQIQRPKIIQQLDENHRENIQKNFFHQIISLKTRKVSFFNEEFEENDRFLREIFRRQIQITDQLIDLYQQIELGDKHIFEYRLDILKFDFKKEINDLENLFIHQHFKEFQNQIDLLISLDENDHLQQLIQFQIQTKQFNEIFFKDMNNLHQQYQTEIQSLQSTINRICLTNLQQTNPISKQSRQLFEKVHQGKERIHRENLSIEILNRKIEQTKKSLENLEDKRSHLNDKLNHLKQCSNQQEILLKTFPKNRNHCHFRRLVALIDQVQRKCQKKLEKIERLFSLINQCEKLELEDEKLLLSSLKTTNSQSNRNFSHVHYLDNCHFEFDSSFDQLNFFWKRFSHVQLDLFIRFKEKQTLLQQRNLLQSYALK